MQRFLCVLSCLILFGWTSRTTQCIQAQTNRSQTLALVNVIVIDGNGGKSKSGMTLVISRGRIKDIFPTGPKKPPAAAVVMDLRGHYAIPGLIDSHYHFIPRTKEDAEARRRFAFLGGITTVREMAGDARLSTEYARLGNDPAVLSPRVYFAAFMAGPTWFGDERVNQVLSPGLPAGTAPWGRAITPETDIQKAVADAKATGATGLKLYADLSPETVARISKEAHRQGLKVWSHATIFPSKPSDAVNAGVDVLSHAVDLAFELVDPIPEGLEKATYRSVDWQRITVDAPRVEALLREMSRKGIMLDDTVVHTELRLVPGMIRREAERKEAERKTDYPLLVEKWAFAVTRRAHELGVRLVTGTDFQEQPLTQDLPNIHTEMELLVSKCGLTPLEAITAATRNGAIALGIEDSYGTIGKGKAADLVILNADPSSDIRNTTKIAYVIKGGIVHPRAKEKSEKNEIRQLIRQWDDALTARNMTFIESILAEDFTYINSSGGIQSRTELLGAIRNPELRIESSTSSNVAVRIYGEVAIATAEGQEKGTFKGTAFDNKYRYTDVWTRGKDGWKVVATQVTAISP